MDGHPIPIHTRASCGYLRTIFDDHTFHPAKQLAAWLVIEWLVYPPNQAEWVQATRNLPNPPEHIKLSERDLEPQAHNGLRRCNLLPLRTE